jgi:hypothetical protein
MTTLAANSSLGMYREVLNDGVCQKLPGEFRHPFLRLGPGQLDLEPLPLPHAGDKVKTEPTAGSGNRLALGIVDLRLQHDVDDESRHIPNSTRAGTSGAGGQGVRPAVR